MNADEILQSMQSCPRTSQPNVGSDTVQDPYTDHVHCTHNCTAGRLKMQDWKMTDWNMTDWQCVFEFESK